jgi:hypothetical protein
MRFKPAKAYHFFKNRREELLMTSDRFRTSMPHLTEFNAFLEELNKESDRGGALISTAMLDDLLEKTILAFLIEPAALRLTEASQV